MEQTDLFGSEKISKILWKLAPPLLLGRGLESIRQWLQSWGLEMRKKLINMPEWVRRLRL